MYGNNERRFAPVSVGEELDVRIEAVGEKGDGVCKRKGFVLFVPNVKEGDEVRIKITKVLRKVGFAEVIGEPQGPIEEDTPPPPRRRESYHDVAKEVMREEPQIPVEDTDDFGEEPEEDPEEEPEEDKKED